MPLAEYKAAVNFMGKVSLLTLAAFLYDFLLSLPQIYVPTKGELVYDMVVNSAFLMLFKNIWSTRRR